MGDLPRLPDDLIFEITDHLWDDVPTLSICSVVCSSWTHEARKHLFRKVLVQSEKGESRFKEFQLFIAHHDEISCFVKHLQLSGRPHRVGDEYRPQVTPPSGERSL